MGSLGSVEPACLKTSWTPEGKVKPLRDYQAKAVEDLRASLKAGKRRPVLQLPVGAGKTRVAAEIINLALSKRKRAIFTVPRIALIDQTVDAFMHEGIVDIGVCQGIHELTDHTRSCQVASVQTLQRRKIPEADLVVIDEAHLGFEFVRKWMDDPVWAKVPFIGLSATPWARGMGKHWDDLIFGPPMQSLIAAGHLSPFRIFAPSVPDLDGVKTRGGDYVEEQLSKIMGEAKLIADVVETWLAHGENRPTLCFGVDRAHAKKLLERFQKAGVPSGYVDAFSTPDERKDLEAKFRSGSVKVACSVGVLTTGVDWPVACIIMARPTKSEMLYVQIFGRGLRVNPGYSDCLFLDHSGTSLKLGYPTDIHHGVLDDGKERRCISGPKVAEPKLCSQCHFLKPPKTPVCPNCGHEAKHGPREVDTAMGQLVELDAYRKPRPAQDMTPARRVIFYAELKGMALERRYKPGWAAVQFKERFGEWPPRSWDAVTSISPSQETINWVKSRWIARQKAQDKANA
jgi:DNA repair protein RadD